ncbi:hypothetical protein [Deinococcus ficus]|uniref:Uncharacterized protein n=1 Tax=Deinococcus ficus TaxID=317577 RepID=A0A221T2P8_9DEIO|nr:hypothetical protein [Deinococcus ficus]ASN83178.1 hypothetical protein DFI_18430 [Deinococcus ficus]
MSDTIFRSTNSQRNIVPGWTNMLPDSPDWIELQIDVDMQSWTREHACVLLQYWDSNDVLTKQAILPMRAFSGDAAGWCAMLPNHGRVIVNAIDPTPRPPLLATHILTIDPKSPRGTVLNAEVRFPHDPGLLFLGEAAHTRN